MNEFDLAFARLSVPAPEELGLGPIPSTEFVCRRCGQTCGCRQGLESDPAVFLMLVKHMHQHRPAGYGAPEGP